jgi:hypothetical protein
MGTKSIALLPARHKNLPLMKTEKHENATVCLPTRGRKLLLKKILK